MPSKPLPFDLVDGNLAEPISVAGLRPVEGVHPRIQGEANARKSFKLVGEQPQAGTAPLPRSQSTDRRAPSVEPTAHAAVPAPDAQIANRRHPIQSSSRPHGFEAQPQPPERISPGSIHPSVTLTSPGTVRGTAQEASVRIPFEVSTPDRTSLPKAAAAERVSPEIFDVLDTDAPAASPQWTHAGTHRLEAGFQDPEVGWVRVRAQQDSGGVHAAVVPASSDASQILSSHLTGLSNYLVEHRTLIESWALAPPENLPEATGASQTGGDATRQERGRDAHPGAPGDESGRGASWASRDGPWATEQRQPISAVPVYEALGNGRYVSLLV